MNLLCLVYIITIHAVAAQDTIWFQAAETADTSNWTVHADIFSVGTSSSTTGCPLGSTRSCYQLCVTSFKANQFMYRIGSTNGYTNIEFRLLIDTYSMWFTGEGCNLYYNIGSLDANWQSITQISDSFAQKQLTFILDESTWNQSNIGIKIQAEGGNVGATSCCLINNMHLMGIPITNTPTTTPPTTLSPTTLSPSTTLPTTSVPTTMNPIVTISNSVSLTTSNPTTFSSTEGSTGPIREGGIKSTISLATDEDNEDKEDDTGSVSWIYLVIIFCIIIVIISIFVFVKKNKKKQRSNNTYGENSNHIAADNQMLQKVQSISMNANKYNNSNSSDKKGEKHLSDDNENEYNVTSGQQFIEMNNMNERGEVYGNSDDIIINGDDDDNATPSGDEEIVDEADGIITIGNNEEGNDNNLETQNMGNKHENMMDDEFIITDDTDTAQ